MEGALALYQSTGDKGYTLDMNKYFLIIVIIVIVLIGGTFLLRTHVIPKTITETLVLPIPFSPQAPTDKWDRNEDCEETSITMANAYLTGNHINELPESAAQNAINNLKQWEQANLGYNLDTGAAATKRMAEGAFGLKVRTLKDFTEADLKNALQDEHPVLLPIDARVLNNPHYKNSGPQYHMVVVRGYNKTGFIINDPGTNSGNSNVYSFEVLKKASADWNHITQKLEPENKYALIISK